METLVLDFVFSDEWKNADVDLVRADEVALRYRCVMGDIVLKTTTVDFSARWGWVTLLDFAYSLADIVQALCSGETSREFEFTESEAKLFFVRMGDAVCLSSNYASGEVVVRMSELSNALFCFAKRLEEASLARFSEFLSNPAIREMFAKIYASLSCPELSRRDKRE